MSLIRRFIVWLQGLFTEIGKWHRRRTGSTVFIATVDCPRCGRTVNDNEHARNAHRQSCVRIPAPKDRGSDWGVPLANRIPDEEGE